MSKQGSKWQEARRLHQPDRSSSSYGSRIRPSGEPARILGEERLDAPKAPANVSRRPLSLPPMEPVKGRRS